MKHDSSAPVNHVLLTSGWQFLSGQFYYEENHVSLLNHSFSPWIAFSGKMSNFLLVRAPTQRLPRSLLFQIFEDGYHGLFSLPSTSLLPTTRLPCSSREKLSFLWLLSSERALVAPGPQQAHLSPLRGGSLPHARVHGHG